MLIDDCKIENVFVNEYLSFKYELNRKDDDALFELVGVKNLI